MAFVAPDACTLPTAERPLRLAEFDALFATTVRHVEPVTPTHARLQLTGEAGLAAAVRDLTAREAACCSFFTFTVTASPSPSASGEAVTLDIEVPSQHADVLASLTSLASRAALASPASLGSPAPLALLASPAACATHHTPAPVDNTLPTRSRVSGILAVVACAACCALPFLIAAGVLTTAGAAILEKTLLAVSAGLAALALGMWWLHRRGTRRPAAGACGCGGGSCGC